MPDKVVDASALAAILFGEPGGERLAARLEGAKLVAPALLDYELANTCLMKLRRHAAQREAILAAYGLLKHLQIDLIDVELDDVISLAEETGLTAYDASYLWLARMLGADLVTLDKQLARQAKAR